VYNPYGNYCFPAADNYIRFFHASPGAPPVDIYINDCLAVNRLAYSCFSRYLSLRRGQYNIKIYPAGETRNPVINQTICVPNTTNATFAVIGTLPNLKLYQINDPVSCNCPDSCIRFVHLSPNAPNVNITLPNESRLFSNVSFKETTYFIPVMPGSYTIQLRPTNTNKVVFETTLRVMSDRCYTVYAVGLVGKEPPLKAVVSVI
jgi:hypothetical protein